MKLPKLTVLIRSSGEVRETKKLFGKRNFTTEDLQTGMSAAHEQGARKIFLTFPSNLPFNS